MPFKETRGFIRRIKTFSLPIRMRHALIACKIYICLLSGHLTWCIYCWEYFCYLLIFSVVFTVFFIQNIKHSPLFVKAYKAKITIIVLIFFILFIIFLLIFLLYSYILLFFVLKKYW